MHFSFQKNETQPSRDTVSTLERHRQGLLTDSGQDADHFLLGLVSVGVTIASHFPGTSSGASLGLMAEGKLVSQWQVAVVGGGCSRAFSIN